MIQNRQQWFLQRSGSRYRTPRGNNIQHCSRNVGAARLAFWVYRNNCCSFSKLQSLMDKCPAFSAIDLKCFSNTSANERKHDRIKGFMYIGTQETAWVLRNQRSHIIQIYLLPRHASATQLVVSQSARDSSMLTKLNWESSTKTYTVAWLGIATCHTCCWISRAILSRIEWSGLNTKIQPRHASDEK